MPTSFASAGCRSVTERLRTSPRPRPALGTFPWVPCFGACCLNGNLLAPAETANCIASFQGWVILSRGRRQASVAVALCSTGISAAGSGRQPSRSSVCRLSLPTARVTRLFQRFKLRGSRLDWSQRLLGMPTPTLRWDITRKPSEAERVPHWLWSKRTRFDGWLSLSLRVCVPSFVTQGI